MTQEEIKAIISIIIDENDMEQILSLLPNKNRETFKQDMEEIIKGLEQEKQAMLELISENDKEELNIEDLEEKIDFCRDYLNGIEIEEERYSDKIIIAKNDKDNMPFVEDLGKIDRSEYWAVKKAFDRIRADFTCDGQLIENLNYYDNIFRSRGNKQIRVLFRMLPNNYVYVVGVIQKKGDWPKSVQDYVKKRCENTDASLARTAELIKDSEKLEELLNQSDEVIKGFFNLIPLKKNEKEEFAEKITEDEPVIKEELNQPEERPASKIPYNENPEFKSLDSDWRAMFGIAKMVYDKLGYVDPRYNEQVVKAKLGKWLDVQRARAKKGELSPVEIEALTSIDIELPEPSITNAKKEEYDDGDIELLKDAIIGDVDRAWLKKYREVKEYYHKVGAINVPIKNCVRWLTEQRCLYHLNLLSETEIVLLERLDIDWTYGIDNNDIEKMWKKLRKNGKIPEDYPLAKLSEEDKSLPNGVSLDWESNLKEVRLHYNQKGNINEKISGCTRWLKDQRVNYHFGLLNDYQITELEKLHIDWTYDIKNSTLADKRRTYIKAGILPKDFPIVTLESILEGKTSSENKQELIDKHGFMKDQTEEKDINVQAEETLSNIDKNWMENYNMLIEYQIVNKTNVVEFSVSYKGCKLGHWLRAQQRAYWNLELDESKINMLNRQNIDWTYGLKEEFITSSKRYLMENEVKEDAVTEVIEPPIEQAKEKKYSSLKDLTEGNIPEELNNVSGKEWLKYFLAYKDYVETRGTVEVSSWYRHNGVNIGSWIPAQRWDKRNNKLSRLQINLLNEVGMDWEIKNAKEQNEIDFTLDFDESFAPKEKPAVSEEPEKTEVISDEKIEAKTPEKVAEEISSQTIESTKEVEMPEEVSETKPEVSEEPEKTEVISDEEIETKTPEKVAEEISSQAIEPTKETEMSEEVSSQTIEPTKETEIDQRLKDVSKSNEEMALANQRKRERLSELQALLDEQRRQEKIKELQALAEEKRRLEEESRQLDEQISAILGQLGIDSDLKEKVNGDDGKSR